jgi:iron(III) transport system permease protein
MAVMTAAPQSTPTALHVSGLVWALIGLLSFALPPWSRTGRGLLEGGSSAVLLLGQRPLLIIVLLALAAGLTSAFLGRSARGWTMPSAGAVVFLASLLELIVSSRAFDIGALGAMLSGLTLLGYGLSASGVIRADGFVAASVVWTGMFIVGFIVFPLLSVLRAAFGREGFTLAAWPDALLSPAFYLLENDATPQSERIIAWVGALVGLLIPLVLSLRQRLNLPGIIRWSLLGAVIGFVGTAVVVGFGALSNSIVLSLIVGTTTTAFGLAFALLATRSRMPIAPYFALPIIASAYFIGNFIGSSPLGTVIPAIALEAVFVGLGLFWIWRMWQSGWTVDRFMGTFSILPMITPPFVVGFALIFLLGRQGVITKGLFGLDTDALLGPVGVGIAQTLAFTPTAYLVLIGVVRGLDPVLEEAAQTLRADRWTLLRTVVWPLLRPGLANAFLLGVIESLADFGNPFVMGGSYLATEIYTAVEFSPEKAAVLGLVLLGLSLSVFFFQRWWLGRTSFVTVTGKPSGGKLSSLPLMLERGLLVLFTLWTVFTLAVYGSVLYGAFVKLWGFNSTFTLEHWANLQTGSLGVFLETLKVAAISAVPATLVGFLIAYLVTRQNFAGRGALEAGSLLSFAIPGTVIGIGYILAFNTGALYLTGTATILVLAFVFRNMPVTIRSSIAALKQIDPSLEEASTTLRAPTAVTLWRVVVPLLRPALISGLIFAFVHAMTAISQIIFLITPDHKVVTSEVLGMVERGQLGEAAALSALLVITMSTVIAIAYALSRLLGGRPEASV